MGKKLYVGNLVYSVTRSDLESWFAEYGTVQSAQVITDRDTGRSKGFGFVEMDSDDQAQAAIQGLNEKEHEGRRLTVNEAKPRVAPTDRGGYGGERRWRRRLRRRWWRSALLIARAIVGSRATLMRPLDLPECRHLDPGFSGNTASVALSSTR